MRSPNRTLSATLGGITIVLGVLLASLFLIFGVGNLINPDVASDEYLDLNTRVCVTVILTGVVSIYALFCPHYGGILLFVCAVALGFVSHVFVNPLSFPILLLGVLSFMRGRLSRQAVSQEPDPPT